MREPPGKGRPVPGVAPVAAGPDQRPCTARGRSGSGVPPSQSWNLRVGAQPAPVVVVGAQAGPGPGAGAAAVEAAGPGGAGAGQPERAEQGDERDDHAEDRQPELALGQGDERDEEGGGDGGDDRAARLHLVLVQAVDAERRETGHPQPHQRGGEHHRLHALAARLGPVHVGQVQDQRELVQHQPRADPEDHGRQAGPEAVPAGGHRAEAADEGEDHAGHHVMDVHAARLDVAEGPPARPDHARDQPGDQEGQHEGGEGEQQGELAGFDDVAFQPGPHGSQCAQVSPRMLRERSRTLPRCPRSRPRTASVSPSAP
ncbi:hypothetical protein GCM10020295_61090 [Streptomyces cinereospinus]